MSTALYRKYRSRSLNEVVGQKHITELLSRAIETKTTGHAYLLTGPRGVGKTSIARILAHEINQLPYSDESHLDIIEIDAASNNSIEDVRDLREKVHIAPTSAPKKIYIIDEVHMLSKAAFNALLKTLEEPPAHIVFIMATTDLNKLPDTIVSRSQRFHFRSITDEDLVSRLRFIADSESIKISDRALERIARHSEGTFRDSISLLDQVRNTKRPTETIDEADITNILGATSDETIEAILDAYRKQSISVLTAHIFDIEKAGLQASTVARQLIDSLKNTLSTFPSDIYLMQKLTEVGNGSFPFIALLGSFISCLPEVQSTQSTPQQSKKSTPAVAKKQTPNQHQQHTTSTKPIAPQPKSPPTDTTPAKTGTTAPIDMNTFSWDKLLTHIKEKSVGVHSILTNCPHAINDGVLVIYAGKAFNANKIKSAKNLPILHACLEAIGCKNASVVIESTAAPPKSEDAASVAAIMGGGEEVST